jgi:ATP-dependent RNA helicase RhlE
VSLVDSEEAPLLRDIEKLLKRSIPRATLEGFVARPVSESASDDRPRQARPQRQERSRRERQPEAPRSRHAPRDESRTQRAPHARREEPPRARAHHADDVGNRVHRPHAEVDGNRSRPSRELQQTQSELSEAARHQAKPQPALFQPRSQQRRRG